VESYMLGLVIY